MYQAMTSLGFAAKSAYKGPIKLDGDPKGASVLVLGAGLAGMTAALELRKAGYKVQVLEYNDRPGGRNWTLRGGDTYTELGGATQNCEFDKGLYINPGPVAHSVSPPRRARLLQAPRRGARAVHPGQPQRLPAFDARRSAASRSASATSRPTSTAMSPSCWPRSTQQGKLDEAVTKEDQEMLLEALQSWGALDKDYRYKAEPDHQPIPRLRRRIPAAGSAPSRCRASRSACRTC